MSKGTYIILGAGGGIGSATARQLHSEGSSVFLLGRSQDSLQTLATDIDSPYRVVDATDFEQVESCFSEVAESAGKIDGIVNCVGSLLLKPAHLTTRSEWDEVVALNLTSAFAVVRAGHGLLRDEGGTILLMTTAAARIGVPNHDAIAAAKGGVIGLAQSAAASYASRGIRVNAVAPGLVKTGMTKRIWSSEKSAEMSRSMHALGRLGEPADIASLLAWLLKPENDWITGQVFGADGGLGTLLATRR